MDPLALHGIPPIGSQWCIGQKAGEEFLPIKRSQPNAGSLDSSPVTLEISPSFYMAIREMNVQSMLRERSSRRAENCPRSVDRVLGQSYMREAKGQAEHYVLTSNPEPCRVVQPADHPRAAPA